MNTLLHPEASLDDVAARIALAEQRLIAREAKLQRQFVALGQRVRDATAPRKLLPPVLGIVFGLVTAWWLRRGRAPMFRPEAATVGQTPWVHWLALGWPLLPARWRARIGPNGASALIGIALPIVERVFARPPAPPLPTVAEVDLARYAGTWFEITRLPVPFEAARVSQTSVRYSLRDDGAVDVVERGRGRDGVEREAHGIALVVPGSGRAQLRLSFIPAWLRWLPFAWGDYWVLHLDDDYRVALVGDPARERLWVLARTPTLSAEDLQALVDYAGELGFPIERLTR